MKRGEGKSSKYHKDKEMCKCKCKHKEKGHEQKHR